MGMIGREPARAPLTSADINNDIITADDLVTTLDLSSKTLTLPTLSSATITSVDINGGTIDGVTIGGSSAGAITGTTGQFNTSLNVDGAVTADGLTVDGDATLQANTTSEAPVLTLRNDGDKQAAIVLDADRSSANGSLGQIRGAWNGTAVTRVVMAAGSDTANKDDGRIYLQTAPDGTLKDRLLVDNNGDISFYEDTGTTPKFFWDASAEALGIGTSSPDAKLRIQNDNGTVPSLIIRDGGTPAADMVQISSNATGTAFLINSSGNVGIGTSSPTAKLHILADTPVLMNNAAGTSEGKFDYVDSGATLRMHNFFGTGSNITFLTNPNGGAVTERARIDSSGNLLVGTSSTFTTGDDNNGTGGVFIAETGTPLSLKRAGSNGTIVSFFRGAITSPVGSISIDASSTAYNTSSDARLKENIADAEDAGAKVDAIQVRQFDWKADGSHQDYGMIAQELLTVAPEAVSGDPESDDMMGVDYSKLVPMMLKEIQSLRARVHALEGK